MFTQVKVQFASKYAYDYSPRDASNKNRERIIYYINIFNLCAYCWITDYT